MFDIPIITKREVIKYRNNHFIPETDDIAVEYPLTLLVNDEEFATIICTPSDLEEMVVGFMASEGAATGYQDIEQLTIDTDKGYAYVDLVRKTSLDPGLFSKRRIASCCGKSRQSFYFFSDAQTAKQVVGRVEVSPSQCFHLMEKLHASSTIHQQTGGVHNAALCTPEEVILHYSDIGRHNALDKIYGHCLKNNVPTDDKILAISGRISSEMLLKAAKIGTGILLSKSAPTDLALRLAEELGITAIGFVRRQQMNVYTHPERIR